MRILIVQETDWLKRGPHDQHHLAEKMSLRGHHIRVIDHENLWRSANGSGLYSHHRVFNNVSKIYEGGRVTVIRPGILKVKIPGADYLSLIYSHRVEIERQMQEFEPDVVVGLDILNAYLAAKAARRNGVPFIYYWIDLLHQLIPFRYFRPLGRIIEGKTLEQTDVVLTSNISLRKRVIEIGAPPERTFVLQHGISFERFNPDYVDRDLMRNQMGIKPDDIVIGYVGRLSRLTGIREVISELARVGNHNLRFLVIGTGSREAELRQMQAELGLQEKLIITGRRPYDEIPALLAASDICALPFQNVALMRDIVPVKVFDYVSMGKPVISTRLPGMVEEFGEGNGIVYVERPEGIIKKAIELVDRGNLEELGVKARAFVKGNSWDAITDEFESILVQAVREKGGKLSSRMRTDQ